MKPWCRVAVVLVLPLGACNDDGGGDEGAAATSSGDDADSDASTTSSGSADDDGADDEGASTPTGDGDDAADGADDAADESSDETTDDGPSMTCVHSCTSDVDCRVPGVGDVGYVCEDSACVRAFPCTTNESCVEWVWALTPCTMGGGECAATQVCVELSDGSGGCASPPSDGSPCEGGNKGEVMATDLDTGMDVLVCGDTNKACNPATGECSNACTDDSSCGTWVCDTARSLCVCGSDEVCGEGSTCTSDGVCSPPSCTDVSQCEVSWAGGAIACE